MREARLARERGDALLPARVDARVNAEHRYRSETLRSRGGERGARCALVERFEFAPARVDAP